MRHRDGGPTLTRVRVSDVGVAVRAYRKASGLSQQELADLAGMSRATLNYLESGRDIEIGAGRLLALLDLLAVPVAVPSGVDRSADDRQVDQALRAGGAKIKSTRRALEESLATGTVPHGSVELVRTGLSALGLADRTALVRQVSAVSGQPAKSVWRNVNAIADQVGAQRSQPSE